MSKAIKAIQAVILLVISFMALVERPGEGAEKKAEVLQHLDEALKAESIVLPAWMDAALKNLLPGFVNLLASWANSVPSITQLFGKVQAVLMVIVTVMTLTDDDKTNDGDLMASIHTALDQVGIILPSWINSALGVVLPILIGALQKLAGGSSLGK